MQGAWRWMGRLQRPWLVASDILNPYWSERSLVSKTEPLSVGPVLTGGSDLW